MDIKINFFLLLLLFSFLIFPAYLKAQEVEQNIVSVKTVGLNYSSSSKVLFITGDLNGAVFSDILIINVIRELYRLGTFTNIEVATDKVSAGISVTFYFTEKERIADIIFEGNNAVSTKILLEKIQSKKLNFIDETTIQKDLEIIKNEYVAKGYSKAKIIYKLQQQKAKTILVFQVLENPKVYLSKINITGSQFFLPLNLKRFILSSEIDCFNWINDSGKFDDQRINADLQIIYKKYLQNGFIKVRLEQPQIRFIISPENTIVEVDIEVVEGDQYFVKSIDIKSLDEDQDLIFTKNEIKERLKLKPGSLYDIIQRGIDRNQINNLYQNLGYAFSTVQVSDRVDDDKKEVEILYQVKRQEKVYINRIEFFGNRETRDDIIRRELTIYDGELFNRKKINDSQARIRRLGYFSPQGGVQVVSDVQEAKNEVDYNFQLQEIQTGNLSGGLSYSSEGGFGINASISKSNFLGSGRRIAFQVDRMEDSFRGNLSFTEPYFLDSKWSSTSSVSREFISKNTNSLQYDQDINGFSQGFFYPIWPRWTIGLSYSFRQNKRTNPNENIVVSPETIIDKNITSNLSYSTINNPFFPSNGTSSSISFRQVGGFLGGNVSYNRVRYGYRYFKTLPYWDRIIFYHRFRFSKLFQTTEEELIPVSARFSLGGTNSIRGFSSFEIQGPSSAVERSPDFSLTELQTDNPDSYSYYINHRFGIEEVLNNFELQFPLTREGYNLRGLFFYDFGNVFAEDMMYEIVGTEKDYSYLRQSYGLGIRIITPLGVLKFDYGIKIQPREGETLNLFEFNIGNLF